jgi:2-keto-4-pentenoate hydratase/2-oxohepta-3-ene-1,7-dioic acid hydratase in catechol pathway
VRLCVFDDWRLGVLTAAGGISDVTAFVDPAVAPRARMSELISTWTQVAPELAGHAAVDAGRPIADLVIRAPQPRPGKVIAAPVNYRSHQSEMGGDGGVYPGRSIGTIDTYAGFVKASSSVVGPDAAIELPFPGRRFDHEGELGVVIGRTATCVRRDHALGHVFGYVPLLDVTMRGDEDRSFRKSFDTFTPIGPAIVTADEVGDPGDLALELAVNGDTRQHARTSALIFDVPRLIELYSEAMTLEPGDVIATGTPDGVGPIEPGDVVALRIESLGELVMPVRRRGRRV